MKYKIGSTVEHATLKGSMVVLAKITIESGSSDLDTLYKCRMPDGRVIDFFDYELKAGVQK